MPIHEKVVTLPNALTLVRLPLAVLIWAAPSERWWVLAILGLAAASDVLDGRVARAIRARRLAHGERPRRISDAHAIGAWLDPLCDKLFVLSLLVAVAYAFHPPLFQIVLVATREIVLAPFTVGYALMPSVRRLLRVDFRAGAAGKATTVTQFAAVLAIVLMPSAAATAAAAAAIVGLAAAVLYLYRAIAMARYAATCAGRAGIGVAL